MDEILLSIIIPVYNLENYIENCINSIISQTNKNSIEIVLIDDGSKDKSAEICKKYCEKYEFIKYFYQENAGVSVARNNGLLKATGKYIWFVDGDDWILEDSINKIINVLKKENNIDIIASGLIKCFDEKTKVGKEFSIDVVNSVNSTKYPENIINLFKSGLFTPSLCGNVIRKQIFLENKIYLDKNVKYTEDIDCTLNVYMNAKKIILLDGPIYAYRQAREGSATTSKITQKKVEDSMNLVIRWMKKTEDEEYPVQLKKEIQAFIKYEYSIVVGLLFSMNKINENLFLKIKEYEHLLLNGKGIKGKLVNFMYKICGFNIVGKCMAFWIKNKNKIKI